jgi:hypothetical protein
MHGPLAPWGCHWKSHRQSTGRPPVGSAAKHSVALRIRKLVLAPVVLMVARERVILPAVLMVWGVIEGP